jgi:hypothetical protein
MMVTWASYTSQVELFALSKVLYELVYAFATYIQDFCMLLCKYHSIVVSFPKYFKCHRK